MRLRGDMCAQTVSLDFGPVGAADVTANLMEAVPCGPALHDPAELPENTAELPFLHIKAPHHPADSAILSQVGHPASAPSLGQRCRPCKGLLDYSTQLCMAPVLDTLIHLGVGTAKSSATVSVLYTLYRQI